MKRCATALTSITAPSSAFDVEIRARGLSARPKASSPAPLSRTTRSRHWPPRRSNWRTGSASRNSLARMIAGPSGASARLARQAIGAPAVSSASYWIWASGGLVSISVTSSAARNSGTTRAARKRVAHQRAAARAKLDQRTGLGRPIDGPHFRRPQAEQLAEHLRDLRRGGEVAFGPERDRASCSSRIADRRARAP